LSSSSAGRRVREHGEGASEGRKGGSEGGKEEKLCLPLLNFGIFKTLTQHVSNILIAFQSISPPCPKPAVKI
jgi:hypothetical protein